MSALRILGIDPGLQRTGFGVIDAEGARLSYVASGTISTLEAPRGDLPLRLKIIFEGVQMKKAVVGHGLANKGQVQEMVRRLLHLPGLPGKDAADALGLAVSHAHAGASFAVLAAQSPLQRRQHAQYRKGRTY
jgi:crossover junction endodeoxyribonuclease RuvC